MKNEKTLLTEEELNRAVGGTKDETRGVIGATRKMLTDLQCKNIFVLSEEEVRNMVEKLVNAHPNFHIELHLDDKENVYMFKGKKVSQEQIEFLLSHPGADLG